MKLLKEGKVYKDDIGQCWPAGLPLIMTRYWPTAMIQVPTAVYMVSEFMNSFRTIFLDGRAAHRCRRRRAHAQRRIGRPLGRRHDGGGHALSSAAITTGWIRAVRRFPAGEQLRIVERIRLLPGGKQLEIAYTMTDPENWEGEWKSTKRFNRVNDIDIHEVECLPDLNDHLKSTRSKTQVQ